MDPFSSKDIFRVDITSNEQLKDEWHGFKLDLTLESHDLHLAEVTGEHLKISTLRPDILKLSLDDVSLESLDASSVSSAPSPVAAPRSSDSQLDSSELDIWNPHHLSKRQLKGGLSSWDHFGDCDKALLERHFLSEAEVSTYDAVISHVWSARHQSDLKYARFDHFERAALNVLVGRSSLIFGWDNDTSSFEIRLKDFSLSGYSVALINTLCRNLCACGTFFRKIHAFCNSSRMNFATTFAVQTCLLQVLRGIEAHVQRNESVTLTLTRVQSISLKHLKLYEVLNLLLANIQDVSSESILLEKIIRFIDETWGSNPPLRAVLTLLADRIMQPSIQDTSQRLGLSSLASHTDLSQGWLLASLLPGYRIILEETKTCFDLAETISTPMRSYRSPLVSLNLASRWLDLAIIQRQADDVETEFLANSEAPTRNELQEMSSPTKAQPREITFGNPFNVNFQLLDKHVSTFSPAEPPGADLSNLILAALQDENIDDEPQLSPIHMLEMSIGPVVRAKHRVCSYDLMKQLFLDNDLVAHLDMLHAFQLLGDGSFASRLSRSLFDADQYSAEGRRKTGLTAGLRLEDREAWPPASSELRLVLMGLLSDSSTSGYSTSLLDCISFAIRDLPGEDLELCRDVHSVHALDFLRLAYAPPNAILELILTSTALDKYDRIFKFLLILLRLQALSQNLKASVVCHRPDRATEVLHHRFCLELYHFVTCFLDYALNVAVGTSWCKMIQQFSRVRDALHTRDYTLCMSLAGSINQLEKLHDDALDEILSALLLDDKHTKLYAATCKIFSLALESVAGLANEDRLESAAHYQKLRRAIDTWYMHIRGTIHKSKTGGLQPLEHLLIKVDYARYYGQHDVV